jgi:hypothetical protein
MIVHELKVHELKVHELAVCDEQTHFSVRNTLLLKKSSFQIKILYTFEIVKGFFVRLLEMYKGYRDKCGLYIIFTIDF